VEGSLVRRYRSTRHSKRVAKAGLEGETAWVVGAVGTDVIRGTQYADQEAKPRNSNAERECIDE
jgi:hypothetical protein